jgi:hypothetical protein
MRVLNCVSAVSLASIKSRKPADGSQLIQLMAGRGAHFSGMAGTFSGFHHLTFNEREKTLFSNVELRFTRVGLRVVPGGFAGASCRHDLEWRIDHLQPACSRPNPGVKSRPNHAGCLADTRRFQGSVQCFL